MARINVYAKLMEERMHGLDLAIAGQKFKSTKATFYNLQWFRYWNMWPLQVLGPSSPDF